MTLQEALEKLKDAASITLYMVRNYRSIKRNLKSNRRYTELLRLGEFYNFTPFPEEYEKSS